MRGYAGLRNVVALDNITSGVERLLGTIVPR
jgi:hypothetical protein